MKRLVLSFIVVAICVAPSFAAPVEISLQSLRDAYDIDAQVPRNR